MQPQTLRRPMTPEERLALQRIYESGPTRWGRAGIALLGFAVSFGAVLLAVVVLWLVVALLAKLIFGLSIGWRSPAMPWVLGISIPAIAAWAAIYNWRWWRRAPDPKAKIAQDLGAGTVIEERYVFTAAKRYQEPEHGGLLYFLRSDDGRAYVVFDHESQDLGVQGKDPLASPFVPRAELVVVRAPETRYVLLQEFSGAPLDGGEIRELGLDPEKWPEPDEFCRWKWDDLDRRIAGKSRSHSQR